MHHLSIRTLGLTVIAGVFAASAACSDGTQDAGTQEAALVSVTPRGASMSVDPNARIEIEFDGQLLIPRQHRWRRHGVGLDHGVEVFGQLGVAIIEIH